MFDSNVIAKTPTRDHLQRLSSEMAWVVVGQCVALIGGMASVRLLTRFMSPTQYGQLALTLTVSTLVSQTLYSPISGAVGRFYSPALEAGRLPGMVAAARRLLRRATLIMVVLGLAAVGALEMAGHLGWAALALGAIVYSAVTGVNSSIDGFQNSARQRTVVAWHQGISQWARVLVAVPAAAAFAGSSVAAIAGYVVASGGVLVSQLAFLRRKLRKIPLAQHASVGSDEAVYCRTMAAWGWPMAIWGLFTWAQLSSDRWALQFSTSTDVVGKYAVLYQVGYAPVILAATAFVQLITPVIFARAGDCTDSVRRYEGRMLNTRCAQAFLGLTIVGTVVEYCWCNQILHLFANGRFAESAAYLAPLTLSAGIFSSTQLYSNVLATENLNAKLIAPKIGTALLGVVLNLFGAYCFGLAGVVWASLAFSCVYGLWIMSLVHRTDGGPLRESTARAAEYAAANCDPGGYR